MTGGRLVQTFLRRGLLSGAAPRL